VRATLARGAEVSFANSAIRPLSHHRTLSSTARPAHRMPLSFSLEKVMAARPSRHKRQ
jgi:hypothetical protein